MSTTLRLGKLSLPCAVSPSTLGLCRLCEAGVSTCPRLPPSPHWGSGHRPGQRGVWRPHSAHPVSRLGLAAHGESQPCLQPKPGATSCSIPNIQMFSMVPYMLNVTAVHPGGVSSSFVPFVPEHISEWGQHRGCGGPLASSCFPAPKNPHLLPVTQFCPPSWTPWAPSSQLTKNPPTPCPPEPPPGPASLRPTGTTAVGSPRFRAPTLAPQGLFSSQPPEGDREHPSQAPPLLGAPPPGRAPPWGQSPSPPAPALAHRALPDLPVPSRPGVGAGGDC